MVAPKRAYIADIEPSVGDDRIGPGLGRAAVRRVGGFEAALLAVSLRGRLHQRHLAVLPVQVQPPVGIAERRGGDAAVIPFDVAGGELQAEQRPRAGAIEVFSHLHRAANACRQLG